MQNGNSKKNSISLGFKIIGQKKSFSLVLKIAKVHYPGNYFRDFLFHYHRDVKISNIVAILNYC